MTKKYTKYDEAVELFDELIGRKKRGKPGPKFKKRKREVIAVFNDFHAPFQDDQVFAEAVADALDRGATRAIVAGDLGDSFAFSRFSKYEFVPVETELKVMTAILQTLASNFERVDVVGGNHDARVKKYFASVLPPDFLMLVQHDLLHLAAAGMDNVFFPEVDMDGHKLNWFMQVGDLIVGHPESSSKVLAKPADNFATWLNQWKEKLHLAPFKHVAQGHTHQAILGACRPDGIIVYELGCLCKVQGYSIEPSLKYRPQRHAYGLFVQIDGVTQSNDSRVVLL